MAKKVRTKNDLSSIFNILLPRCFHLHHIDCDRNNNDLDNLIILKRKHHWLVHNAIRAGYNLKTRKELNEFLRAKKITRYMVSEITRRKWRELSKAKGKKK